MNLVIDEKKARALYPTAAGDFKAMLTQTFGEELFSRSITDRIKTFEDVCDELNIDPKTVGFLTHDGVDFLNRDADSILAYIKLILIARALNEGWEPDWTDSDQYKYFPWLTDYSAGVGFSYAFYAYWVSGTCVGSRLCFKSRELALYAGTQFRYIYNDFFLIK